MSMLSIYHLVSFSKKYIYSVVSQKIVHGKILTSNLVLFLRCHPLARISRNLQVSISHAFISPFNLYIHMLIN